MSAPCRPDLRDYLLELHAELQQCRLVVELIPSQDPDCAAQGGRIRVAVEHNPEWYQHFCSLYLSTRRRKNQCEPDTRIKRAHTLRLLQRLAAGLPCRSVYAEDLLSYAEDLKTAKEAEEEDYVYLDTN